MLKDCASFQILGCISKDYELDQSSIANDWGNLGSFQSLKIAGTTAASEATEAAGLLVVASCVSFSAQSWTFFHQDSLAVRLVEAFALDECFSMAQGVLRSFMWFHTLFPLSTDSGSDLQCDYPLWLIYCHDLALWEHLPSYSPSLSWSASLQFDSLGRHQTQRSTSHQCCHQGQSLSYYLLNSSVYPRKHHPHITLSHLLHSNPLFHLFSQLI